MDPSYAIDSWPTCEPAVCPRCVPNSQKCVTPITLGPPAASGLWNARGSDVSDLLKLMPAKCSQRNGHWLTEGSGAALAQEKRTRRRSRRRPSQWKVKAVIIGITALLCERYDRAGRGRCNFEVNLYKNLIPFLGQISREVVQIIVNSCLFFDHFGGQIVVNKL